MFQNINRLLTNAIKQDTRKFSHLKLDRGFNVFYNYFFINLNFNLLIVILFHISIYLFCI